MINLEDKNVLLTGASGDIGKAIVKELHKKKANICISGTSNSKLSELSEQFDGIAFVKCNFLDRSEVKILADEAKKKLGTIDILINNAGITRDNLFLRMQENDWNDVLNVNLEASRLLIKEVIRDMIKKRWGRIVNISSVVAFTGNPGQANYITSKAGLIGLTKVLALELATRGITVNSVAPGFIKSNMTEKLNEDQNKKILENIPMKRMGSPEDIAFAVKYLVSNEANYITGQTFHVNGGLSMI